MFCFDTGHANMWRTWEQYVPRYLNKISALHIHDNHGKADEHLLPGDGTIDFISFFKVLKAHDYNGYLGLECVQRIGNYPGDHMDLAATIFQRVSQILAKTA
jgi:sugar phosphate isomerase/epimerase